jgi:hypothetical protein
MIDLENEQPLDLYREANQLIWFRRYDNSGSAKAASKPKMHRLAMKGVKGSDGRFHKLETLKVAGTLMTTREACLRFIRAINGEAELAEQSTHTGNRNASEFLDSVGL